MFRSCPHPIGKARHLDIHVSAVIELHNVGKKPPTEQNSHTAIFASFDLHFYQALPLHPLTVGSHSRLETPHRARRTATFVGQEWQANVTGKQLFRGWFWRGRHVSKSRTCRRPSERVAEEFAMRQIRQRYCRHTSERRKINQRRLSQQPEAVVVFSRPDSAGRPG